MKKYILLAIIFANALFFAFAQTADKDKLWEELLSQDNYLSIGFGEISFIVGFPKHQWLYSWPHDLIPDQFDGYLVIFSPVDRDKNNLGMTKENWGKAVVLSTTDKANIIKITCKKDYEMGRQPWVEMMRPLDFKLVEFHGLKAGFSSLEKPKPSYFFVFKQNETVFEIEAITTGKISIAENMAKNVAEQIWKYNSR
jgi:hypothetical protein